MTDMAMEGRATGAGPALDRKPHPAGRVGFLLVLLGGLAFAAFNIFNDTNHVGEGMRLGVFAMLGLALVIALGFEFVNGFHDTANAVATVIYTHSLPPMFAVVWSGFFNFLGVMVSTGAVAYGIVTLLPVELILQVGSGAGYAMIFALLIAANCLAASSDGLIATTPGTLRSTATTSRCSNWNWFCSVVSCPSACATPCSGS